MTSRDDIPPPPAAADAIPAADLRIRRVRHEPRRRRLVLERRRVLSPTMLRLTFRGDDLAGFTAPGFDDHIKLFLTDRAGNPVMRDYTPRRYDPVAGELDIDFAMHAAGTATDWARSARPGTPLEIGGPRGSVLIEDSFDWYVLMGDETAVPAIARRLEELRVGVPAYAIIAVDEAADQMTLRSAADLQLSRIHRSGGGSLEAAARACPLLAGSGMIWMAGEASAMKTLRRVFVEERSHPRHLVRAAATGSAARPAGMRLSRATDRICRPNCQQL